MCWQRSTWRAAIVAAAACAAAGAPRANAACAIATQPNATERVDGIGGFFFRAKDPKNLARWYQENFGIPPVPESYGGPSWKTEAGTTVFAPFPQATKFGDPSHSWMLNFRVHDLDKMAAQLQAKGIAVKVDPKTYPNGRFAELHDPEGNAIQLWQPGGTDHE
jgi:predicted enzyme related to lactoylglutathione lyase